MTTPNEQPYESKCLAESNFNIMNKFRATKRLMEIEKLLKEQASSEKVLSKIISIYERWLMNFGEYEGYKISAILVYKHGDKSLLPKRAEGYFDEDELK